MIAHLELTDGWRCTIDPYDCGLNQGFHSDATIDFGWPTAQVPGPIDATCAEFAGFIGLMWYRCRVRIPADWQGRTVSLAGEGIYDRAEVWIDGLPAGAIEDPFLPWSVTVAARPGSTVLIAIRVDNRPRSDRAPGRSVGWRPLGGLLRPVRLQAAEGIAPTLASLDTSPDGELSLVLADCTGPVRLTLCDVQGDELIAANCLAVAGSACWSGRALGIRPWCPDDPALYLLRVSCGRATASWRIGFRRVAIAGGRVTINGQAMYLCGFNLHEDRPSAEFRWHPGLVDDLRLMRASGANLVRLSHYPHDQRTLDACDAAGMLVLAEVPLYWTMTEDHDARLAHARRQLGALIARDRHHPSVIIWSVSNETDTGRDEVAAGNAELVRLARASDPTRLATHVSNSWTEHPDFAEDNIAALNAYPSWGLDFGSTVSVGDPASWWREQLDRLAALYPEKPILISEFGMPGLPGQTAVQAQAIAREATAFDHPAVCGAVVWCWADHLWPFGHVFSGNLAMAPFGVVSRDRRAKPALAAASAAFHRLRKLPVTIPASEPAGDDVSVQMELLSLQPPPEMPFPTGFSIRMQRPDDDALWTDIQRDAEPVLTIDDDLFRREYGHDPAAIPQRCCIITGPGGAGIGTIAAWSGRDGDPAWGRIHWVAVRRAFQGKGLARAALAHALRILAVHHDRAWLLTSSSRIGAIALYLSYGFTPVIRSTAEAECWRGIKSRLNSMNQRHNPPEKLGLSCRSADRPMG